MKLTPRERAAACECISLMMLLAEAKTPHSKELAIVVALRLDAILGENAPLPKFDDETIALWGEIARQLAEQHDKQEQGGPSDVA